MDEEMNRGIVLRKFADADLPRFRAWLEKPHIKKWFHEPEAWMDEVRQRDGKFAWVHHFIAEAAGKAVGFCQYYDYALGGESWHHGIGIDRTCSIDYLIGEEAYLGRHLAVQIISALEEKIRADTAAEKIIVQPEAGNRASRAALLSAGYSYDAQNDLFIKRIDAAGLSDDVPLHGSCGGDRQALPSEADAAKEMLTHPFPPLYDGHSKVLILGSFPSVKSREQRFFYGHPQNRFWRTAAAVFSCPVPQTIPEKRTFLLSNGLALWDVIASCEIKGSSDASIRRAVPNDLSEIFRSAEIQAVFCNGTTAYNLYQKYIYPVNGRTAVRLPSTSPANAAWTTEKLIDAWSVIKC